YAGTVILISHDRDFLDRTVNAVLVPEGGGRWVEYAGGYTDMLAQRGADLAGIKGADAAKPQRAPGAEAPTPPIAAQPAKGGLSCKEKHALGSLRGEIAGLRNSVRRLQKQLDDPDLYARNRQAFTEASEALAASQSQLAAAEERWLELELLREEIEGA